MCDEQGMCHLTHIPSDVKEVLCMAQLPGNLFWLTSSLVSH